MPSNMTIKFNNFNIIFPITSGLGTLKNYKETNLEFLILEFIVYLRIKPNQIIMELNQNDNQLPPAANVEDNSQRECAMIIENIMD